MRKTGLRAVAAADAAQLTIARIIDEPAEAFFISSRLCPRPRTRAALLPAPEDSPYGNLLKVVPKTAKESKKFRLQGMEVRQQILDLLLGQYIAETAHLATP